MSRNLKEIALIMTATAAYEQYGVFGHSCPRLSTPKGNIPSDKQKCQPKAQHEFVIKAVVLFIISYKL